MRFFGKSAERFVSEQVPIAISAQLGRPNVAVCKRIWCVRLTDFLKCKIPLQFTCNGAQKFQNSLSKRFSDAERALMFLCYGAMWESYTTLVGV